MPSRYVRVSQMFWKSTNSSSNQRPKLVKSPLCVFVALITSQSSGTRL
jgi:hypothetical protein